MTTQTPPAVDVLPEAPDPSNRTTFGGLAFAFTKALASFRAQLVALAANVKANADSAAADASSATQSAVSADASMQAASSFANAAAAVSGAAKWVANTVYAEGVVVWSPINQLTYRRSIAGAGSVDPSLDKTNWTKTVDVTVFGNSSALAQAQAVALCF